MNLGKKYFLLLSMMFVLLLAACSNDKSNEVATSESSGKEKNSEINLAQGVTDKEIRIGYIAAQTGPAAAYDIIRKGADSYLKYVNENGGVNGRQVKLIPYDNQMQPAMTVQLAKKAVESDKVFALLGTFCTSCNAAIKDYVVEKGIPMVLSNTGATEFVDPPIKNYMGSIMPSYQVEAKVLFNYAVNELGSKNIAIVFQNDDFGEEGLTAVKEALKDYPDVKIVAELPFTAGDTDFSSQAQKLSEAQPDAVLSFALMNQAANLKKAMYKIGLDEPNFLVSYTGGLDNQMFELAGKDVWEGTYSTGVYPLADSETDDEDIQLFLERFKADYPNDVITGNTQAGWAMAQVLVESLKRTGEELTWDNYLNSFYTFDNWDGSMYAGITFSKENHYGLTSLYITQAKDEKIQPITEQITFDPLSGEINYSE